jgi:hypothetical protein
MSQWGHTLSLCNNYHTWYGKVDYNTPLPELQREYAALRNDALFYLTLHHIDLARYRIFYNCIMTRGKTTGVPANTTHTTTTPTRGYLPWGHLLIHSVRNVLDALDVPCSFGKAILLEVYRDGVRKFTGPEHGWTCAADHVACFAPFFSLPSVSACALGSYEC